jgi:elongation factor P--(R)-beta-lysine ligase
MRRRHLFELIQSLREFFHSKNFLETMTPPLVQNPGMETHIHPFKATSVYKTHQPDLYLHTSPEFCLKELLADYKSENLKNIYSLSYCFRDEPNSPIHRPQFLMLEWYRLNERYEAIMQDIEDLISWVLDTSKTEIRDKIKNQKIQKITMSELWQEVIGRDPLDFLDTSDLKQLIKNDFKDVPIPQTELSWDDYFFLLFLNKIEPRLKNWPLLLIYEFPAPLSALATIKNEDSRVCERFEVYVNGIELCNSYNELTDPIEQKRRFELQKIEKKSLYQYELPEPTLFLNSLDKGLPPCSGVALGVERLLHSLFKVENPFFY